jgi:uncharacterized protein (TIGR02652 family)
MTEFFPALQYPFFGSEINCPNCQKLIPALILTDAYLCDRHGAFEVQAQNLVHLQSGRCWSLWQNKWYRQHTHPDGLISEIQESLDQMYRAGWRTTKIAIAQRYQALLTPYLQYLSKNGNQEQPQLFGISVEYSAETEPCWQVINFELVKQMGIPTHYFWNQTTS